MKNCIIHLIGYSGVGKYTIAKAIAAQTDAKIVDNHLINNPIFAVMDTHDGVEFSSEVWQQIDKVRDAVLETIQTLSPPENSFIFTHALMNDKDHYFRVFNRILDLAAARKARYIPIRLHCSQEQNLHRIVQEQRKERLKPTNPTRMLDHRARSKLIDISHDNLLDIEISDLSAADAAEKILQHIASLKA